MEHDTWWLAALGRTLVWARLREREAGIADVFDNDGRLHIYDSVDTARAMLLDAGYVEFDGMDEDDALSKGFSLHEISPPRADNDDALAAKMTLSLGGRA